MAISPFSLSKKSPSRSSSKMNGRKPLETKRKLLCKKPSALKAKSRKIIYDAVKKSLSKVKKAQVNCCLDLVETKYSAMRRAQEVQANLPAKYPSFIKPMLLSHVTGGFWLSLPRSFCNLHMPKEDDHIVILVNENEEECSTKYLTRKNGLSGGWRGFSIAHKLLEGDVLVFQLVQPCKFKVYIVRANGLTELDGAIGLLTLDACSRLPVKIDQTENDVEICGNEEGYYLEPLPLNFHKDDTHGNSTVALNTDFGTTSEQNGNESDEFGSEVLEGLRFSVSTLDFKTVKSIESFAIHVDGLIIDSEIPPHLRIKYYDLCCGQETFLHDNLLKGLNLKLVSGIISETVNIADAIRASKFTNSKDNFTTWDKTLEGFEKLGMNVGFLRARIERLVSLAFESQILLELKKVGRVQAEAEMRTLEAKLLQVKEGIKVLNTEIEELKGESRTLEAMFKKEANAPW